jgi:hemerythrin-like metal-binding protein
MHVEWDEQKYTTGFPHIDDQHRELFDGLNGLTSYLRNSSAEDDLENQGKILEMLEFLGEYAGKHFRDEEELFAQCDHPMATANKEAHQAFVEKYLEYHEKLINGTFSRALLIQLHIFLRSWLINHIVKVDTALRECVAKPGMEACLHHRRNAGKKGVFARFLAFFQGK